MDVPIPFGSVLLKDMAGTPEMRGVWSERRLLDSWIEVERAITSAQAELGMIPSGAAAAILEKLGRVDPEGIAGYKRDIGHLMVSFLKYFRELCGPAAEHFHVGPTTQDILDTGLALQMRSAQRVLLRQMREVETALCERAREHQDTVLMGRTHQQHAVPLTFGFVLAGSAAAVRDHYQRARESEKRWLLASVAGAVGAQNAFVELAGADATRELEERVCRKLGLGRPTISPHARTDRFAEVAGILASLVDTLGKFALDLRAMQRTEVGEVEEPFAAGQFWSSTMPCKKNPEATELVAGLAGVCRGLAQSVAEARVADCRDATRLPAQYFALPGCYLLASRALDTTRRNVDGLVVHPEAMRRNLDHPGDLGLAAAERLMIAIYKKTGQKDRAHSLLHRLTGVARRRRQPLRAVFLEDAEAGELLSAEEVDRLCDLSTYVGTAPERTLETVRRLEETRAAADDL